MRTGDWLSAAVACVGVCIAAPAFGQAPVNDECDGAIDIVTGSTTFSTVQATTSGLVLAAVCDEGFGTAIVKDVWYRFTPLGSGTLTVTTCSNANFDTRLAAYTGACRKLALVACNDDSPVCFADRSLMQVPVVEGVPVLIRVGGFNAGGSGTLTLTSDIPPPNDDCANAFEIDAGSHAVTTINATTDGAGLPGTCNQGTGLTFVNDVWFRHVPQCTGTLTVSTCNGAVFDTRLAAYTDGPCESLTLIACNDDSAGCNFNTSLMQVPVVCGQPVLLRVGAFNGSGNMLLNIGCEGRPCPPPCPADIDGNTVVNTDDLLVVITSWGACEPEPEPCPADVAPPGGNDAVDTDDLILVITSWGACNE